MSASLTHADWILELILKIDAGAPGFCGSFLRTSDEKRQVVAAFLVTHLDAAEKAPEVAHFLLTANHHTILSEAYGAAPVGLRGALRRSGPLVHDKRFYGVLYRLLANPRHHEIIKCISRLDAPTLTKLRVVNILPPELCRPNVVEALPSIESANDLVASIDLIVAAGGDREKLVSAIQKVRGEEALPRIVARGLLDCRGVEHPVPAAEGYRPVETAGELHAIAARFRNCARTYTIDLLDREAGHAFAEVRQGKHGAVAHLRQREGRWTLEGIYGPRNSPPVRAVRQHAIEHLKAHGIALRERQNSNASKWNHVRRMTTLPMFEFEFE